MGTVGLLIVAVLLPTLCGFGYVAARRLNESYQRRRPPTPPAPLVRVHADLRRLYDLLDETENAASELPGKHLRCKATRAAYLDALTAACRHLDVPAPAGRPVPREEIYRVEAALRLRGLDVRAPV